VLLSEKYQFDISLFI